MKRKYSVKNNYTFQKIIKNNKKNNFKEWIIYFQKNVSESPCFGISVGKKLLKKAVSRNKVKRQLRSIISTLLKEAPNLVKCSMSFIIIIKKSYLSNSFEENKILFKNSILKIVNSSTSSKKGK